MSAAYVGEGLSRLSQCRQKHLSIGEERIERVGGGLCQAVLGQSGLIIIRINYLNI